MVEPFQCRAPLLKVEVALSHAEQGLGCIPVGWIDLEGLLGLTSNRFMDALYIYIIRGL